MKKPSQITPEEFENLLGWFSNDREKAGEKYEEIRRGLIRFFRFRGCCEPEFLTDETINRIAGKVCAARRFDEDSKTIAYIHAFALNIYREYVTDSRKMTFTELNEEVFDRHINSTSALHAELEFSCLESCLAKLSVEESGLILQYYSRNKIAKTEIRAELAEKLNLKAGTLHTRVHRLRSTLRNCVEKCVSRKKM